MWTYYSVLTQDTPMIVRSSAEVILLTASCAYILRNKVLALQQTNPQSILPT